MNPVGIVTLTIFSAEAQGLLELGLLVILVLVVAAIDLGVFLISHRLDKYLTRERIMVLEKLLYASTPNVRNRPSKISLRPDARPQEAEDHSAISHWKHIGIFLAALAVQLMVNGLADLHIITVSVH